eukprot:Lithocolla_globosa_v1_NODE_4870_length_1349_cov_2.614374.p2 type:complete len:154 gc:universal NODE_4870_length_1349_cov_2.614374:482-21(-)
MLVGSPDKLPLFQPIIAKAAQYVLKSEETSSVGAAYLGLIARMLLLDHQFVLSTLSSLGDGVFFRLLDTWIDRVDVIGQAPQRKLTGFAFCSLLRLGEDDILKRLGGLVNVVLEAIFQLQASPDTFSEHCLFFLLPGLRSTKQMLAKGLRMFC